MGNINVGTTWIQERIWLRKQIEVPRTSPDDVILLRLRYDEDADIFVNGVRLMHAPGWNDSYGNYILTQEQKRLFHEGPNTLAVSCRNTGGGQAIDLGLTVHRGASDVVAEFARSARKPDQFEVGAIWMGPRTHLDPVTPGDTLSLEMEILQRMGGTFLARLTTKGQGGQGDRLVFGRLTDDQLELTEPTSDKNRITATGKITDKVWKYGFDGKGAKGAQRWGHGEMKPRQ